ncbi:unnamed protein product [Acanthoscelides obtectus]|uniref:Potassium channel domain-containing protein n=3 Tax=Acanthoscelides obtectus TaxID=200917 RepID=A0A9P0L8F0_ACAOB|nr:unnamed protein product [Acanthoscelides obtectus]CAK1630093.1 TWiK family of potassium channels protein 18 [Acanthoscelides obtectus]
MERRYKRGSSRSAGGTSMGSDHTPPQDPREKVKDCCRKIIAFMCTQLSVGALVFGYTLVGAVSFMHIEKGGENVKLKEVTKLRGVYSHKLYQVAEMCNIFEKRVFIREADYVLKEYQNLVVEVFRHGYDERKMSDVWTFPAALMYSLSIITMIGYGNMVPKTAYGKLATVIYALFGIPLYILYFLNVGDALAEGFRWIYRWMYKCGTESGNDVTESTKRIIVPSTACLWVIAAYVLTGAVMFGAWERWDFLDSIYFCVTSLCKLGFGDFVPGANIYAEAGSHNGNQTKLMINFVYILFGLGLVAMCYNLMREEIREKLKEFKEDFAQCLEDTRLKVITTCNHVRGTEEVYY